MNENISILPHTEKSFIVITKKHLTYMASLRNLGGVFDVNLFNKENGKKFMGWIFYMDKKDEVLNWINNGCPKVEEISILNLLKETENRIQSSIHILFSKIDLFESELKRISEQVNIIKNKIENQTEEDYEILNTF
jgi:hypothetical protein